MIKISQSQKIIKSTNRNYLATQKNQEMRQSRNYIGITKKRYYQKVEKIAQKQEL